MESFFTKYLETVKETETILYTGAVTAVKGLMIESVGPRSMIGELCDIRLPNGTSVQAEVMGLAGSLVKLMAYGDTKGIVVGLYLIQI